MAGVCVASRRNLCKLALARSNIYIDISRGKWNNQDNAQEGRSHVPRDLSVPQGTFRAMVAKNGCFLPG